MRLVDSFFYMPTFKRVELKFKLKQNETRKETTRMGKPIKEIP